MKIKYIASSIYLLGFSLFLSACSGGGGSDASTPYVALTNGQAASVVIGQADFVSISNGSIGASNLNNPNGSPEIEGSILYLPDSYNNRVLGFNSLPTVNDTPADFVLGQTDFTTATLGTSLGKFDIPQQVSADSGKLIVTDYNNSRILIWNSVPISGNIDADIIVGLTGTRSCSATTLYDPESAVISNGKLIIADSFNNRVLIYNQIPTSNNASPNIVVGQNSLTNCKANDDDQNDISDASPSSKTLSGPTGIWTDGNKLVVADSNNNRVLIWNNFPSSDFQPADIVLGQVSMSGSTCNDQNGNGNTDGASASTLCTPSYGVDSNGTQLVITDRLNNRVLLWNQFPTFNTTAADVVLGQLDFSKTACNDSDGDGVSDASPSATSICEPTGVLLNGSRLIVSENANNRSLIYNSQ